MWSPRRKSSPISSLSSIVVGSPIDSRKDNDEKQAYLLPVHQKPKFRVRTLLSHCLYRRVLIWSVAILFLVCLVLSTHGLDSGRSTILQLVDANKPDDATGDATGDTTGDTAGDTTGSTTDSITISESSSDASAYEDSSSESDDADGDNTRLHWLKYKQ